MKSEVGKGWWVGDVSVLGRGEEKGRGKREKGEKKKKDREKT